MFLGTQSKYVGKSKSFKKNLYEDRTVLVDKD